MRAAAACAATALLAASGAARAHGGGAGWDAAPSQSLLVLVPLSAAAALYAVGLRRRAARGLTPGDARRSIAFFLALLLLLAALVWPLDAWSQLSFAAHMAQHMVLVVLAPPLLVLARPAAAWLRGLPAPVRRPVLGPRRWPGAAGLRRLLDSPNAMAALHGALLWAWHVPVLFELALRNDVLHWFEHLTLLGSGVLFWRVLLRARGTRLGWGLAAMLTTLIHTGLLGALLTLSPRALYGFYGLPPDDALRDQQLAGLIMWVPMGTVYLLAAVLLAAKALAPGPSAEAAVPAKP